MSSQLGNQVTSETARPPSPGDRPPPAVAIGNLVISWNEDEPVRYGGPRDRGCDTLAFELGSKSAPVLRCDPAKVAPADTPIPARDARVTVVRRPRTEMPYGAAGQWRLTLAGTSHPSWHRTKRDGTAAGLRRLAILDWHAASRPPADS